MNCAGRDYQPARTDCADQRSALHGGWSAAKDLLTVAVKIKVTGKAVPTSFA